MKKKLAVIGAEPLMGNDAALSLRAGHIVAAESEPQTIADGARTLSLGKHNWEVIRKSVPTIVEVSEAHIAEALRLLFELANVKESLPERQCRSCPCPPGNVSRGIRLLRPKRSKRGLQTYRELLLE